MAKKAGKTEKLTVLLIRDTVKSPTDALRSPSSLTKVSLKTGTQFAGEFWYAKPSTKAPYWQRFVEPVLSSPLQKLFGATVSAVLFVEVKGRHLAITFGHGRNLLKADCFVLGFGLKAALNRLNHKRIRSMDLKTYEEMVLSTKKQSSTNSDIGTFGLDVARDLVRTVTGEPADPQFAKRVTGSDACVLNVAITAGGLGKKCAQLVDAYNDTTYKSHFEWIDHLSEVRDAKTIDKLNDLLLQAIRSAKDDRLHLAPAEPIDWLAVDKFRIAGTRGMEYDDLDIDEYLTNFGNKRTSLTVEQLKSYRVSIRWTGSEQFASTWTLFNCLVWETMLGGRLFSLVDGKWFAIEPNFSRRVKKFVHDLPPSTLILPDAIATESEEEYNERIAKSDPNIVCLDRDLVKPIDAATSIEFCDLLSKDKHIVHVKKKTRSATLSHLFAQGTVSAREFLQDGGVRDQIISVLKSKTGKTGFVSLIPPATKRPTASDYEVAFAIIAKPNLKWPDSLPFFSQLNLMQQAKTLQGLGFRVTIQLVADK